GKFRIEKLLLKGGVGTVYLAVNTEDNNARVALKLIELGPDPSRQEIATAELRGATLQRQICDLDRRITRIRDFGTCNDFFYIEMEYIEGKDLSELLTTGPLGIPFAARIGLDLCEVIHVAHTFNATIEGHAYRGIVHGDIKPRNIRITPDGDLRVLDFGIAKALSLTRSYTQILFGSSQYSSPERLNTGEVTFASDLWAVGVVLWEIVTARPYFEAETGPKLEAAIRNYKVPRPTPPNLPPSFAAILRKALHPDESVRYQSAAEFRDDLKSFLDNRPTLAESDTEVTRRTIAPPPRESTDEATRRTAPPPAKPPLTRPARQIVAGTVLAVTLIFVWFISHEVGVWNRADALARELQTEKLTDLNAAFVRYRELQDQQHVPLILSSARRTIFDKFTAVADRHISEYRESETPTVTENDWVRGQAALAKALELDPANKEIRAKIAICEGHIARIRGSGKISGKLLNEARAKFEQAHELESRWSDPYIGLAALYTYSLKDVERAEEAMDQAAKRGHKKGRREKTQLADAYRSRAERLLREADKATGLPEEKDYLHRAGDDLQKAQDYYRDIVPFGGSTTSLRRTLENLETIDLRLRAIKEGA
ncbi:MAG: protein kinase, partial [Bryobacteraceae bacterium]|nr:protein kinase [Bryobacteraceae bacterium]